MKMYFKNREAARQYNKKATNNKAQDGGISSQAGKRWFVSCKNK